MIYSLRLNTLNDGGTSNLRSRSTRKLKTKNFSSVNKKID